MNRQSWTNQEDHAIKVLVDQFGVMDWTNISQKLKLNYQISKRTGKQCRERWYNHLNPEVNKKPWTHDQENLLFQIHRKSGNRWKLMSKYFEGRTDNDIKNHFYSTLRRSLRRLNKFIGQKNSTTQMRQIKPSVLSTIMNYIYQQEQCIDQNIVNSLKDLPYLIFQFSNYKPVKTKVKIQDDQQIKTKINFIFTLINSFNSSYQQLKLNYRNQKGKKCKVQYSAVKQQQKEQQQQKSQLMKYFPKKSSLLSPSTQNSCKKPRIQKKQLKKSLQQQMHQQQKAFHPNHSQLMQQNNHIQYFVKQQQESYNYQQQFKQLEGPLRERRISLEEYQDFMDDQSIGDLDQPSKVGFCASGMEDLIIVGKQLVIHHLEQGQAMNNHQVKQQTYSSNQNLDELIN